MTVDSFPDSHSTPEAVIWSSGRGQVGERNQEPAEDVPHHVYSGGAAHLYVLAHVPPRQIKAGSHPHSHWVEHELCYLKAIFTPFISNYTDSLPMCTEQSRHYCLLYHSTNPCYVAFCLVKKFVAKVASSRSSISGDIFQFVYTAKALLEMLTVVWYFTKDFCFFSVWDDRKESTQTRPSLMRTSWNTNTDWSHSPLCHQRAGNEKHHGSVFSFNVILCECCCLNTLE